MLCLTLLSLSIQVKITHQNAYCSNIFNILKTFVLSFYDNLHQSKPSLIHLELKQAREEHLSKLFVNLCIVYLFIMSFFPF